MRLFTLFVLSLIISPILFSQELTIREERNFGGSDGETGNRMLRLANGDLMICGSSSSKNGDIPRNNFGVGLYLMKLDKNNKLIWTKVYGMPGEYGENARFAQTPDGGFVIAATNPGCSRHTPAYPSKSLWLLKVNDTGMVEWEHCAPGNSALIPAGIIPISDGYMVAATGTGSNGWMEGAKGRGDIFIARLDLQGNLLWRKMFGGSQFDEANDIVKTSDGNFVIAGCTRSTDGDIANSFPYLNAFLCKIDDDGNVLWQKTYGRQTERIHDVLEDFDGSLYIAGAGTRDTEVSHFGTDGWIAKFTSRGDTVWNKLTGGTDGERFLCLTKNDKNEVIAGGSLFSSDDEVAQNVNRHVPWVTKYNEVTKQTTHGFFGTGNSFMQSITDIQLDGNGDILFVATSYPDNPFMSQPKGGTDTWLVTLGSANKITGKIFFDADSSQTPGPGEKPFTTGKVRLTASHRPEWDHKMVPDSNGKYTFTVDTGAYAVQFVPDQPYYSSRPVSYSTLHSTYNNIDTADFGVVVVQQVRDLSVNIIPLNRVTPGFESRYLLTWRNMGTLETSDTKLIMSIDANMKIVSADDSSYTVSGNKIIWNLGTTSPFDSGHIKVTTISERPPLFNLNDTASNDVTILPDTTDITKVDNTATLKQIATGSFDPNDKSERHGGAITHEGYERNEYLQYTIRFQNTGNDTAYNIRIADTLDEHLDPASLQMVAASHSQVLSIESDRYLVWRFDNIRLVDSNRNEPSSHGFVSFRIKPRKNLPAGTTLLNKAAIYFDFNLPVVTNTVTTVILDKPVKPGPGTDTIPTDTIPGNEPGVDNGYGLSDPEFPGARIYNYPNPTRGSVTLKGLQQFKTYTATIISPSGQVCYVKNIAHQSTSTFRIGQLSKGLYFLRLMDTHRKKNLGVLKLVVE